MFRFVMLPSSGGGVGSAMRQFGSSGTIIRRK